MDIFNVNLETALLIPSGAAVLIYVFGSAAGARLLRHRDTRRVLPWISLVVSVVVLPFVGPLFLVATLTAAAAAGYSVIARRARPGRVSP